MKVYSLPTERRVSQPSTEKVVEGAAICETLVTDKCSRNKSGFLEVLAVCLYEVKAGHRSRTAIVAFLLNSDCFFMARNGANTFIHQMIMLKATLDLSQVVIINL